MMMPWRYPVHHSKDAEAQEHHGEELHVVLPYEGVEGGGVGLAFIFQHEPISAEEEEYGHSVMSEEREELQRKVP